MKREPQDANRDALGCFLMVVLGGVLTLGGLAVVLPRLLRAIAGEPRDDLGRSILIWMVAPAIGMAVLHWLTFGARRKDDPRRRR